MDLHSKLAQLRTYRKKNLYNIISRIYEGHEVRVTFQKFKKYDCFKKATLSILSDLGVDESDIIIGNDAPRGGKLGNFIRLKSMSRNRIIDQILN